MKSLTVAIHTPVFPNKVQTYILSLIVALRDNGIKTVIVAQRAGHDPDMPLDIEKYRLLEDTIYIRTTYTGFIKEALTIPLLNPEYRKLASKLLASRLWKKYGWRYFIKGFIRIKSLVFRNFDLIHSHTLTGSYDFLFLKDIYQIPIITTFHGKEPRSSRNLDPDKTKMVFRSADIFLVNTKFARQQLIDMGCPREKIRVLPQGTNLNDFPYYERTMEAGSKIILLTVGRLSIEKGHHIAIEAFSRLAHSYPNLEYHIIGSGPESDNLAKLISTLDMDDRIRLLGSVSLEQLHNYYSRSHIFILPSIDTRDGYHVETQGVVLQEAQASGLPVIASTTGGIPESVIDDKTGLLFREGDASELAEKIRLLVDDHNLYTRMSRSGRKDVETRYNIELIVRKMIDIYISARVMQAADPAASRAQALTGDGQL